MALGDPTVNPDGTRFGATLLVASGFAQLVFGFAAVGGLEALERNVRRIEATPQVGGKMYLGLSAWGVMLLLFGAGEIVAGLRLARRRPSARLIALAAAMFGLAIAFFTLAFFRVAAVVTIVLLLLTIYVLSYHVKD